MVKSFHARNVKTYFLVKKTTTKNINKKTTTPAEFDQSIPQITNSIILELLYG